MSRNRRFWLHPLTRMLTWLLTTAVITGGVTLYVMTRMSQMSLRMLRLITVAEIIPAAAAFLLVVWALERNSLANAGLGLRQLPHLLSGICIGGVIGGVTIGLLAMPGWYHFSPMASVWPAFALGVSQTVIAPLIETLAMQGLFLRSVEERYGTWPAVLFTAGLYGVLSQVMAGTGFLMAGVTALASGLLLCSLYVWTRNLWLVMGARWAWNLTAGFLLGGAAGGPAWVTGGWAGAQAGLVSLIVSAAVAVLVLRRAVRAGRVRRPGTEAPAQAA